jgi:hypothetical protein
MIRLYKELPSVERVSTYRIKLHVPTPPLSDSSMADSNLKGTRRRASTPRSKKGCITCKLVNFLMLIHIKLGSALTVRPRIRRLKCGEEKPGMYIVLS